MNFRRGGDFLLYVFIGCFAFGVLYAAVSFILGGHGDHSAGDGGGIGDSLDIGHDIDFGHGLDAAHDIDFGHGFDAAHDIDIGQGAGAGDVSGAEAGHGADIQHGTDTADNADSPSPFNPLVIASAITTFGGIGLISMKGFGLSGLASTIVALGFAGAIGAALFFGIVKFMYGSQSNSIFSLNDLIGTEAEVITSVPGTGLGEIAFIANSTRYTLAARSLEGDSIQRGSAVIIREIAGSVAVVQKKLTIDDIELFPRPHASAGEADVSAGGTDISTSTGEAVAASGESGVPADETGVQVYDEAASRDVRKNRTAD